MSFTRGFFSSSIGTAVSRVLGLGRDVVMASYLGVGDGSDAIYGAIRIPGVLRRFVADEGLTGALVPAVAEAEEQEGTEKARTVSAQVLLLVLVVSVVVSALALLFAPQLVWLFVGGFADEPWKFALTVDLVRIVTPFVVSVSYVSWAEGVLNCRSHFFVPKVAPGVVSLFMMAGCFIARDAEAGDQARIVAWTMTLGGVAHAIVCMWPTRVLWGLAGPAMIRAPYERVVKVGRELGKVVLIGVLAQANIVVIGRIASTLPRGSLTWYWYGVRVVDVAQGIIAVGVGSAILPVLARSHAAGDHETFKGALRKSIETTALFLCPAGVVLLLAPQAVVGPLFQGGKFSPTDVQRTGDVLSALVPYMVALGATQVLKKPFFAVSRRKELIAIGLVGLFATSGLGAIGGKWFGVVGLAGGLSVSVCLQAILQIGALQRAFPGVTTVWSSVAGQLARIIIASGPVAGVAYGLGGLEVWTQGRGIWPLSALVLFFMFAGLLYCLFLHLLGVYAFRALWSGIRGRLGWSRNRSPSSP